jgi:hypothetical protein
MKIQLFHFNKNESLQRVQELDALGYEVDARLPDDAQFFKRIKEHPPDIVVIDLSRLPSGGRDIGIVFRTTKATRFIPLVFVDGLPEKIERVREHLPDAVFTTWEHIESALNEAVTHPLKNPVVPASTMAGYAGTPLPKKLGIKENMRVGVVNAPDQFDTTLGQLPTGATLIKDELDRAGLILWFLRSKSQLDDDIPAMLEHADHARIWMIWPKKTSALKSDLTQQVVRETGLNAGLVDFKVCAVDDTWSGLLFTLKK